MADSVARQKSSEAEVWDFYNGLLLSPDVERIRKLLVRYDLFRLSADLPGDIVECGVFKGAGLMYWLKLLAIYAPASRKKVIGFDAFGTFSKSLLPYEQASAERFVNESAHEGADVSRIGRYAADAGLSARLELVSGEIEETAATYVAGHPGFRISLLHLDLDAYAGTKAALSAFYDRLVPGGIVVCDEYAFSGWGESDAVDEFLKGQQIAIRTVPNAYTPTAYFVKPL